MNLADLSIRRPTFIVCIVVAMLAIGILSMQRMGVDQFPNVTFPIVIVVTQYSGASPHEIETLVSKPIEDEIGTISGLKRLRSINRESMSTVVAEFTLETDIKYAEQQVRDKVTAAKRQLPKDYKEPIIRRVDPAEHPVAIVSVKADVPTDKLYDLTTELIQPKLEQLSQVALVEIIGGRKREIRVELDREKLKEHEISASLVTNRLAASGRNIPLGRVDERNRQTVFRTIGEFRSLQDIESSIINFFGNEIPLRIKDVGKVVDSLDDERSRVFVNGNQSLFLFVFRQSGANTIAVADAVIKKVEELNSELKNITGSASLKVVRDGARYIRLNVTDVKESILLGIVLTIIVVFLFLGNIRSTIITGLAIPNSLLGAFILMHWFGFTINVMSLLALSLSVGLLIDDAIVVRENIFRHLELGKTPLQAALDGTAEVRLAVIATTCAVIAVFLPVAFLHGVTGQFFKQFGLTICFVMAISLFDALTIAPMLSAYLGGIQKNESTSLLAIVWRYSFGYLAKKFSQFQDRLEKIYGYVLSFTMRWPVFVLLSALVIFASSIFTIRKVPKTFVPTQDNGEFMVSIDTDPSVNLNAMTETALKIDKQIRLNKEVATTSLVVGGRSGETNVADFYVRLVPSKERLLNTSQFKEKLRGELLEFSYAHPKVRDFDMIGGGMRPFTLEIIGSTSDQETLESFAKNVFEKIRFHPGLKDADIDLKPGKPELQVQFKKENLDRLGVSQVILGNELRTQIEGDLPARFREGSLEYDIRVRLNEAQRNLRHGFNQTYVPNINNALVRLSDVAYPQEAQGPSKLTRLDRSRYIEIAADIAPGAGIGNIMDDLAKMFQENLKLPQGIRYLFLGQAENFKELSSSMLIAGLFAVLFIFLILSSLYESFITPLTIMLALPLAICGSFFALFIMGQSLNIFSMIGTIMLLGVATKNSILLVDYAHQLMEKGKTRTEALMIAGKTRLRPILMTTMALIAGTLPIALGLNEASKQRTAMGIAIIGGLISSTILTLVVVPAAFSFIDRFKVWSRNQIKQIFVISYDNSK